MEFSFKIYISVCVCACMYIYIYSLYKSSECSDYVTISGPHNIKNADFNSHYLIFAVTISNYAKTLPTNRY